MAILGQFQTFSHFQTAVSGSKKAIPTGVEMAFRKIMFKKLNLLFDTGCLTLSALHVVKLRSAHFTFFNNFDLVDGR